MAIAADFLSTPRFMPDQGSFLVGKVAGPGMTALSAKMGTRYNVQNRVYDQRAAASELTQPRLAALIAKAPAAYKMSPGLVASLRERGMYDEKDVMNRYLPGWDSAAGRATVDAERDALARESGALADTYDLMVGATSGPAATSAHLDMYRYMAAQNALPTLTFYKPVGGTSGVAGTRGDGPNGLQQGFASRLMALIAEVKKRGHNVQIGSGWRSYAQQVTLKKSKPHLAATPGRSNHGWGLAADLRYSSREARDLMHKLAPQFGLRYPMAYEPWHIEPMTIKRVRGNRVYTDRFSIVDLYQQYRNRARKAS